MAYKGKTLYLSHGGGPMPILNDETHLKMIEFMKEIPKKIEKPDKIIVISAHWEEKVITIQSGDNPDLMYDYYGFPKEAYEIEYPCKGDKELALQVAKLLEDNNIEYKMDENRPYDHGSYIPLKLMYEDADIPVIQISLNRNLDATTHLKLGKALRSLMKENILIIGSGFSFHNMERFDFYGRNLKDELNDSFQDKLIEICCDEDDEDKRWEGLNNWEEIRGARYAHVRQEHLIPLMVCLGAKGNKGEKVFDDYIVGKRAVAFLF